MKAIVKKGDELEPVWITGVGAVTPLGCGLEEIEANLLAGRSGVSLVTRFPTHDYPSRMAAQVPHIPCPATADPREFLASTPLEQVSRSCIDQALCDAGLEDDLAELRVGLVLGIGAEWMLDWEDDHRRGGDRINDPGRDGDTTIERLRRSMGFAGPALALSAACASGNHALEVGRHWLRLGIVDVCVAGACEMAVTPIGLATFGNLRALSRRNDEPTAASRPFDRGRDGFVLGEGGVVFVLERAGRARRRSAPAYAAVIGCGNSSDAYHPVIPSPDRAFAAAAMRSALADARVELAAIDHVNAHATSTPVGDSAEAAVLRGVLGHHADRIPVTSTKSLTGHMLTAAGAFEALACLTALRHQAVPPTINLDEPDVDLRLVANEAQPHRIDVTVSNSFGFGGSNTSLVLRAV
jgi:3-oxoacyl-[acyl-carrier-protein] synthase II